MSIEIDRLSYSIGHKTLLQSINLSIPKNAITVLAGPNGAGKSTLLKACASDLKDYTGKIHINNKNILSYTVKDLANIRAVMTQSYDIGFNFTVREVIAMGSFAYNEKVPSSKIDSIIDEVMDFMQVTLLADRDFLQLSGGEQQRTQLARVLTQLWYADDQHSDRYLLLDEPTSSLDIFHQHQVLKLAQQLKQRHISVLAVIHDLSLAASFADKLVLLKAGKVVDQGTPETVLSTKNLQDTYQVDGYYYRHNTHTQPTLLINNDTSD